MLRLICVILFKNQRAIWFNEMITSQTAIVNYLVTPAWYLPNSATPLNLFLILTLVTPSGHLRK